MVKKGLKKTAMHTNKWGLRLFLGFLKSEKPDEVPSLWPAWNIETFQRFLAKMDGLVDKTSITILHSANSNARRFMRHEGFKPHNWVDLDDQFKMLTNAAQRAKSTTIRKRLFSKKEEDVLRRLYLDVYHSEDKWSQWNETIDSLRPSSDGNVEPLTAEQLVDMNGLMIVCLFILNFPRTGNFGLVDAKQLFDAVLQAFNDFKFRFPDEKVTHAQRRLDRGKCVPAVCNIPISTKTGHKQTLVILRPRDQRALMHYYNFVRPNGPVKPSTSKFFINASGKELSSSDVWYALRKVTESAGIEHLTGNLLRSCLETESGLDSEMAMISDKLDHSPKTAIQFYRMQDARREVQLAHTCQVKIEEIGEAKKHIFSSIKNLADEV